MTRNQLVCICLVGVAGRGFVRPDRTSCGEPDWPEGQTTEELENAEEFEYLRRGSSSDHRDLQILHLASSRRFFTFLRIFDDSMAPFGVRRGFKMIGSHRALSSLNMSSYRAIWTHFSPIFIFFIHLIHQTGKSCRHLT